LPVAVLLLTRRKPPAMHPNTPGCCVVRPRPALCAFRSTLAVFLLLGTALASAAAQTGTGIIQGRIFNPATGEYVRNAEVALPGTNLVTYSLDDGTYQLTGVPAGAATVTVTYTGYEPAAAQLTVAAGAIATRDFELKGAIYRPGARDSGREAAVLLDQFVVSTEREGNAKAIMEQRAAVNVKSVVASDNFGDITGGTVGEFIKYLPGVVMDYVDSDARTARIGGLDPRYAGVSFDGVGMASAPSASFGASSRQFEFEQASINGIESIEISKTSTASMDADTPAGRINLRSRSAFDRKGRDLTAQLTFTGNQYTMDLRQTRGPYEGSDYKIRPGFVFTYADAFKGRFGVQLTLGANTVATEQAGVTHTFNYANAARGPVITQIAFRDAPKLSSRASFNLTTDYKLSPQPLRLAAHLGLAFRRRHQQPAGAVPRQPGPGRRRFDAHRPDGAGHGQRQHPASTSPPAGATRSTTRPATCPSWSTSAATCSSPSAAATRAAAPPTSSSPRATSRRRRRA
jgi:iron complex outermembrane receptor protein